MTPKWSKADAITPSYVVINNIKSALQHPFTIKVSSDGI